MSERAREKGKLRRFELREKLALPATNDFVPLNANGGTFVGYLTSDTSIELKGKWKATAASQEMGIGGDPGKMVNGAPLMAVLIVKVDSAGNQAIDYPEPGSDDIVFVTGPSFFPGSVFVRLFLIPNDDTTTRGQHVQDVNQPVSYSVIDVQP